MYKLENYLIPDICDMYSIIMMTSSTFVASVIVMTSMTFETCTLASYDWTDNIIVLSVIVMTSLTFLTIISVTGMTSLSLFCDYNIIVAVYDNSLI